MRVDDGVDSVGKGRNPVRSRGGDRILLGAGFGWSQRRDAGVVLRRRPPSPSSVAVLRRRPPPPTVARRTDRRASLFHSLSLHVESKSALDFRVFPLHWPHCLPFKRSSPSSPAHLFSFACKQQHKVYQTICLAHREISEVYVMVQVIFRPLTQRFP